MLTKIKVSLFLVIIILVFTGGVIASSVAMDITAQLRTDFNIFFNGNKQIFKDANGADVYPILYNGTTYLPVRALSELNGKKVDWDENSKSIYIKNEVESTTDADQDKIDSAISVLKNGFGEKDYATGYPFGFMCNEIITDSKTNRDYYLIWMQWLVDNSHYSTIGQYMVSVDNGDIYSGYYDQQTGAFGIDNKLEINN